jgi:hypothetical protein
MIRDRNIANDAAISPSKIAGGMSSLGPRDIHYVCKSDDTRMLSYLNARVPGDRLHTSILTAVAGALDHDVIMVYPGTYAEGAVINITQAHLKLIAAGYGPHKALSETYIQPYGAGHDAIDIEASNVEVAGFGFVEAAGKSGIRVAPTLGTGGVFIHDCYFYDVAQTGDYHVIVGGGAPNPVGTVIEDCHFFKGKTGLTLNGSRSMVRRCVFENITGCQGIQYVPNASDRGGSAILDCNFFADGTAATQYGIKFTGTPDDGTMHIDGNHFVNFASAAYAISISGAGLAGLAGLNYWGITPVPIS